MRDLLKYLLRNRCTMELKWKFGSISILFIWLNIAGVFSIMCHDCSSKIPGQEDCLNLPEGNTKYLVNCTAPKDKSCRIQEQWMDFALNEPKDKDVIRRCASTEYNPISPCFYRVGYLGKYGVCYCLGDGCNESSRLTSFTFPAVILFVFLVKFLF